MILILISYILIKNRNIEGIYTKILALTICIETYANLGYWFYVGTYEVQYSEGLIVLLTVLSVLILFKKPFNKRVFYYSNMYLFAVIASIISLLIDPLNYGIITYGMPWYDYFYGNTVYPEFTIQTIKMLFRIIIYIIISIAAVSTMKKDDIKKITNIFLNCGIFVIIYILFEFLIKNIFKSDILNKL